MHQRDLAAEAREEIGLLHGGIAAADHHDLAAAIKEAIAGGAGTDAMADELVLRLEAQPTSGRSRRDDDGAGFQPLAFDIQAKWPLGEIGVEDRSGNEFGAEVLSLELHILDQFRPVDSFRKSGEILHQSGERKLAAGFVAPDYQRLQIGACGVDRGGVSGTAGTNNDNVSHGNFQVNTMRLGKLKHGGADPQVRAQVRVGPPRPAL